ncbi:MAG: hypothetical protein EBS54_09985, partial [Betaproteobacteria bacterium]|nr:hypothetical protein [Betaproteobacteria bacterium]
VLINTVGKVPADLFDEFEGKHHHDLPSGDVKYHQGFSADVSTPAGPMHLALTFNPSHLEIVNPVVEGSVRARQDHVKDTEGRQIVPILIHGDAAFAGQGVVMEVIDMVCFRKLGHNEQDEPMVTQPLMYRKIAQHPGTRALYAQRLVADGLIGADAPDAMVEAYKAAMDAGNTVVELAPPNARQKHAVNWLPFIRKTPWHQPTDTSVPATELKRLADRLVDVPNGFKLHGRVEKIVGDRRAMGNGELPLDWGMAENLAYASLVSQGYSVRLSGQDCGRGTFFHRHAVLHDQNREDWRTGAWVPLQHIAPNQSDFTVIDSVLSEEAVLGFEYGYATFQPDALVIWEGQFGDFANGAQVVIDQFIASGETKWGRLCGLTMMLPHGYEGQGPEHSSGRLERYLQLCAEYNIQV